MKKTAKCAPPRILGEGTIQWSNQWLNKLAPNWQKVCCDGVLFAYSANFIVVIFVSVEANLHRHARHDTDRTVLSCLVWRCEFSRPYRQTSAFSVGVCRAAQCDRWTHLSGGRADSIHTAWHDSLVVSGGRCELVIKYFVEAVLRPVRCARGNCPLWVAVSLF